MLLSDIIGKAVTTLVNEEPNSRSYEKEWNPANIASGIYLYRLTAGNYLAFAEDAANYSNLLLNSHIRIS